MLLQSGLCIVLPLSCHSVTNDARLFSSAFKLVRNNEMIKDRIKISSKEMQGKHGPGTRKVNLSGDKCKNPKIRLSSTLFRLAGIIKQLDG